MKQIRKLLALVLACLTLVLALPSTALAANRGEPAGYVSQVNSAFTMPKPGQALPTTATNYVADTIVTAAWEPSGNVAVDQTYTCKVRLVLGDGDGYPIYVYAQWILITDYTVLLPDGDNITVDPATKIGSAQIGIQSGSTIPEDKQLQMSVNAGTHYDDAAQCYRLRNNTGGQLLFYVLAYKGNEVNPGNAQGGVLLETADSDAVFAGFQNRVSVTVGTARTAGRYTDTLTFRFALV